MAQFRAVSDGLSTVLKSVLSLIASQSGRFLATVSGRQKTDRKIVTLWSEIRQPTESPGQD